MRRVRNGGGHDAGELKGERQGWMRKRRGSTEGRTEGEEKDERESRGGDLLFYYKKIILMQ